MNSDAESPENFEAIDNQGVTNDTSSIEFRKNNYGGDDAGLEFEFEGEVTESKPWDYLRKSSVDYLYNTSEEEECKQTDLVEFETPEIEYESSEIKFTTLDKGEREKIIERLKLLYNETKLLIIKNKFLHKKYINLIWNLPSTKNALEKFDESIIFEDTRYQQALENYAKIRDDVKEKRLFLSEAFENLEKNFAFAEMKYQDIFESLMAQESAIAKKIVARNLTKQDWKDQTDRMLENQRRKLLDVAKMRLNYLQLQYKLDNAQAKLKTYDNLGPGFSVIDYEVLHKKKEVCTDKCEEQYESIKKYNESNLSWAATIKYFDEELDMYDKKLENKMNDLNLVSNDNQIRYRKNIEMVKKRAITLKNITKLRIDIGLLDNIFLLKKMETDLRETTKLKKRIEIIKSKIHQDQRRRRSIASLKQLNKHL